MKAMVLERTVSLLNEDEPLRAVDLATPEPIGADVLIKVHACGICHTELDEIEGRLTPPNMPIVLGHQVVGTVVDRGPSASLNIGTRVGVGWIHHSSGTIDENIDDAFRATGYHVNGGYAEYMRVPSEYAYEIPAEIDDVQAAPLLCAGAIGYRSLKLANIKRGGALGLTGFGGSAHLVLQLARYLYPGLRIFVFARDDETRRFASTLGADWTGHTTDRAPQLLDAVIDTTPAWRPVVEALANLRPGGRLVINAIRKEDTDKDALSELNYHEHLWMEREIKSVANITRHDIAEFLPIAAAAPLRSVVETYALADANRALVDLKRKVVRGAKVLLI